MCRPHCMRPRPSARSNKWSPTSLSLAPSSSRFCQLALKGTKLPDGTVLPTPPVVIILTGPNLKMAVWSLLLPESPERVSDRHFLPLCAVPTHEPALIRGNHWHTLCNV